MSLAVSAVVIVGVGVSVVEFEDGSAYREDSAEMAREIRDGKLFEHAGRAQGDGDGAAHLVAEAGAQHAQLGRVEHGRLDVGDRHVLHADRDAGLGRQDEAVAGHVTQGAAQHPEHGSRRHKKGNHTRPESGHALVAHEL